MNIKRLPDDKIYYYESCWRQSQNDKKYDDNGVLYPFPVTGSKYSNRIYFISFLLKFQNYLDKIKHYNKYQKTKDCLICNAKDITDRRYMYKNIIWENGLIHYIKVHYIKPSSKFIKFVYDNLNQNSSINFVKIENECYKRGNLTYIVLKKNQIMILDALMKHGGYSKKYTYDDKTYRYFEHSGMIDFADNGVEKIIVSIEQMYTNKINDEIFMPKEIKYIADYEYIFHTHPPTPKPRRKSERWNII